MIRCPQRDSWSPKPQMNPHSCHSYDSWWPTVRSSKFEVRRSKFPKPKRCRRSSDSLCYRTPYRSGRQSQSGVGARRTRSATALHRSRKGWGSQIRGIRFEDRSSKIGVRRWKIEVPEAKAVSALAGSLCHRTPYIPHTRSQSGVGARGLALPPHSI